MKRRTAGRLAKMSAHGRAKAVPKRLRGDGTWISLAVMRPKIGQVVLTCWEGMLPKPGWLPTVFTWRGWSGDGEPEWDDWSGWTRDAGDPEPTHWQPIARLRGGVWMTRRQR